MREALTAALRVPLFTAAAAAAADENRGEKKKKRKKDLNLSSGSYDA